MNVEKDGQTGKAALTFATLVCQCARGEGEVRLTGLEED